MITSLSGTFLSVSASYTHSTALGGQETSLIQSVNAYLFLHEVLDDQPGRDSVRDFLADVSGTLDAITNLIPDTLYESQGGIYPVNFLTNAAVSGSGLSCQVSLNANISGWGYIRLTDPNQALLPIVSVVRSDGKMLNTNNFWTSLHFEPVTNFKDTYLNLFDLVGVGHLHLYGHLYQPCRPAPIRRSLPCCLSAPPATPTASITSRRRRRCISSRRMSCRVGIYDSLNSSPFALALPFSLPTRELINWPITRATPPASWRPPTTPR